MDQPGKVANPARGPLNSKNDISPVPVRAGEFGLARQVRRPVPSRVSLLILHTQADWCLLTRFLPLSATTSIYLHRQPPSGQSRIYQVTPLCTDGVHCREYAGRGPAVLKIIRVTDAAFSGITVDR